MLKLYHHPLCHDSRRIRLTLNEKNIEYDQKIVNYWERNEEFLELNPAGSTPVLVTEEGRPICGAYAISEYIEEAFDAKHLLGRHPLQRAEIRRLIDWFGPKLYNEVTRNLVWEKYFKKLEGAGESNSKAITAGRTNILYHLDYIEFLTKSRRWLYGDEISLADITAATQISILDYFGDVPWSHNRNAKMWYAQIKIRPSFSYLLTDRIPGLPAAKGYINLEF